MKYKVIHQLKERNFDREHSKSEAAVLDYLEEHFQQIPAMTVVKVAAESYTSQATVNRTCKLLGFVGYSQLKYAIEEDIKLMHQTSFSHVMDTEYMISKIDFETAIDFVKHLIKSRSKLLLFGLGGSHISAQYLQRQLLYLHPVRHCFRDADAESVPQLYTHHLLQLRGNPALSAVDQRGA